jgi:2-amino-4-hydroxy-6-hydroxymethyldihydropteridine diphosphokinase
MPQVLADSLVALGANAISSVGGPADTLRAALAMLPGLGIAPLAVSRFFASPAFPPGSGPDYVNAALVARTALAPAEVLARLHGIEARLGRRRAERWGPRAIDLDLLACGDAVLPDAATVEAWIGLDPARQRREAPGEPILPHPRLQDRAFVLVPLAEVAPGWRHPILRRTVAEMLAALPEADKISVIPL